MPLARYFRTLTFAPAPSFGFFIHSLSELFLPRSEVRKQMIHLGFHRKLPGFKLTPLAFDLLREILFLPAVFKQPYKEALQVKLSRFKDFLRSM
jgi:hypothetical protein